MLNLVKIIFYKENVNFSQAFIHLKVQSATFSEMLHFPSVGSLKIMLHYFLKVMCPPMSNLQDIDFLKGAVYH